MPRPNGRTSSAWPSSSGSAGPSAGAVTCHIHRKITPFLNFKVRRTVTVSAGVWRFAVRKRSVLPGHDWPARALTKRARTVRLTFLFS